MKIGIITIHNSPNYGACLQSFALYKFLEQHGYSTEIIDLHRPYYDDYVVSKKYKPYSHNVKSIKRKLFDWLKKILKSERDIPQIKDKETNIISESKFHDFNSQIRLSKPFRGIDELYRNPPEYDVYITGSDQVWNPTQNYCLEPYFLTFVKNEKALKISYASSIGIDRLLHKEKKDFKRWLNSYDSISVREKTAQSVLSEFVNKNIEVVADPTFLLELDYWKNIAQQANLTEKKYILLFSLSINKEMIDYAMTLSKESGKELIVLHQKLTKEYAKGKFHVVNNAGPIEFLGYIANADFVLTDSFHCTVFSLILGVGNFYTYISPFNNRGSRIVDLLAKFEMNNHILDGELNKSYQELDSSKVNKLNVEHCFIKEQTEARKYLEKAINGRK